MYFSLGFSFTPLLEYAAAFAVLGKGVMSGTLGRLLYGGCAMYSLGAFDDAVAALDEENEKEGPATFPISILYTNDGKYDSKKKRCCFSIDPGVAPVIPWDVSAYQYISVFYV